MTRHPPTVAPAAIRDKLSLLRPLRPTRNLTSEVVERITDEILSGRLAAGARLPTEQAMMVAMGVSRTVIREAVAALRAEGLVTTRQGSGAFVAPDASRRPFRLDPDGLNSLRDVLGVMELRMAIEIEAAALAGERASEEDVRSIDGALSAIDAAIERGEGAVAEDFAFHCAIATATGNQQFIRLLEFLGRVVIPRQSIRLTVASPAEQAAYLRRIQTEHRKIEKAIRARDPVQARSAMRTHLVNGLARYRRLVEQPARTDPQTSDGNGSGRRKTKGRAS